MRNQKTGIAIGSKVSPTSPYLLSAPMENAIKEAAELGYDGIELHMKTLEEIIPEEIEACQKHIPMEVCAISTGSICYQHKLFLNDPDETRRNMAIEETRKYIQIASRLKTDLIFANIRGNIPAGMTMDDAEAIYADSLEILSEDAKAGNVRMLLELTNRYEANYLNNVDQGLAFMKKYPVPMTALHLDTFHLNIEENNMLESIRKAGEQIGYFHVSDNTRLPMGCGHIPFDKVFEALYEVNYKHYITVECLPSPSGRDAAEKSISLLNLLKNT